MDNNPDVPEVQHSERELGTIRALTRIDPSKWKPERLEWLWNQIKTQDYAYDDFSANNPNIFLGPLFMATSDSYEIEDDGVVMLTGIVPKCSAFIHYVVWGDVSAQELFDIQRKLFDWAFTTYELHRITAFIPDFNKNAVRMAQLGGFKYEGEMRQSFLKNGKFHNVYFYGLLRSEFYKKGKVT